MIRETVILVRILKLLNNIMYDELHFLNFIIQKLNLLLTTSTVIFLNYYNCIEVVLFKMS